MSSKTIYIFIKEARIEEVIGADDFVIFDYDLLESYECPVCNEKLNDDLKCEDCDIDWNDIPDEETQIKRYAQFLNRT